jgi:signal transduction histidine kinase
MTNTTEKEASPAVALTNRRAKAAAKPLETEPPVDYMLLSPGARRLRFPPSVEEAYKADYHSRHVETLRMAFLAGFVIYSAFGIMDYFGAPFSYQQVWLVRFGIGCPALALTIAATYMPRFSRYMQPIGCATAIIAGSGIVRIIQITRPDELVNTHYYAGIILVMLFTSSWLRLRFWYVLAANTLIVLYYEYVAIHSQRLPETEEGKLLFFGINFLLLGGYIIAAFTCYSFERQNRMDFLQRRTIEAEKNKSNAQRAAFAAQAKKLSRAVASLKKTQTRLVHSEKMASLGELTAGIAHEIKNPLNFVNNFSEVSAELADDLEQAVAAGKSAEAITLTAAIRENLNKIAYHGKRADSIIRSMLQHSRKGTGEKEPIEINALLDEYLRLSYQGFRTRDKSFNARFETFFDESAGRINVVAQDIGRVVLNLFNNAFYSTAEKKKKAGDSYQPLITVSTKKTNGFVEIRVRDNGGGISQKLMDKIYQPFFTTKPAGEGVGLGLSLSHDIITQGHNGSMTVESEDGLYAEFIIRLPV